ncbi:hypothetical protein L7F22_054978 [Adiantum nelumboides]|nr:hypothetical protein [Adiantum nelumboides]
MGAYCIALRPPISCCDAVGKQRVTNPQPLGLAQGERHTAEEAVACFVASTALAVCFSAAKPSSLALAALYSPSRVPSQELSLSDSTLSCNPAAARSLKYSDKDGEVSNEYIVAEAWQVVNDRFLDARSHKWSPEAWLNYAGIKGHMAQGTWNSIGTVESRMDAWNFGKSAQLSEYTFGKCWAGNRVRETLQKSQERQKKAADRHRRDLKLKENDWVLLRFEKARLRKKKGKERLYPKLSMRYYGPFQITERINDVSFRLRLPDTWKIHNAFHVSLLKPFRGDVPDEQPEVEENEKILVPEQILAHKDTKTKGKVRRKFLVKFKNYPALDAKWMEEEDLADTPQIMKLYLEAFGLA